MKIYNYHPVTGVLISESIADVDPLDTALVLIPAHATEKEPPATGNNEVAVFKNDAWTVVPDFTGQTFFDQKTGEPVIIDSLGEIPAHLGATIPTPVAQSISAASARSKRDLLISAISWRYERHARELRLGMAPSENIGHLDTYVQALADVPEQSGFPTYINWPVTL